MEDAAEEGCIASAEPRVCLAVITPTSDWAKAIAFFYPRERQLASVNGRSGHWLVLTGNVQSSAGYVDRFCY